MANLSMPAGNEERLKYGQDMVDKHKENKKHNKKLKPPFPAGQRKDLNAGVREGTKAAKQIKKAERDLKEAQRLLGKAADKIEKAIRGAWGKLKQDVTNVRDLVDHGFKVGDTMRWNKEDGGDEPKK